MKNLVGFTFIMNIENQCVSLEIAKKMKELGFLQESLFWWTNEDLILMPEDKKSDWKLTFTKDLYSQCQYISAYSVAELGEMLPEHVGTQKEDFGWAVYVKGFLKPEYNSETEANARGKILIYLKDNDLLK